MDDDCEDQALCPTDSCTKFACQEWDGGVRLRPALVKRGDYWICPKCFASYGENPHPKLTPTGRTPSQPNMQTIVPKTVEGRKIRDALARKIILK